MGKSFTNITFIAALLLIVTIMMCSPAQVESLGDLLGGLLGSLGLWSGKHENRDGGNSNDP
ncbi:hypothetical protein C5167_041624 [Papaver somniferum]|nr:hypothetical protein C5167_041624 [Papaver somniferum]